MLPRLYHHRAIPTGTTTFTMVPVTRELGLALMLHHTLTKIDGESTQKAIKILEIELGSNLIAVPCPWGHKKSI